MIQRVESLFCFDVLTKAHNSHSLDVVVCLFFVEVNFDSFLKMLAKQFKEKVSKLEHISVFSPQCSVLMTINTHKVCDSRKTKQTP